MTLLLTPTPWMMVGTQNPIMLLELTRPKNVTVRSYTRGSFIASRNPCWRRQPAGPASEPMIQPQMGPPTIMEIGMDIPKRACISAAPGGEPISRAKGPFLKRLESKSVLSEMAYPGVGWKG